MFLRTEPGGNKRKTFIAKERGIARGEADVTPGKFGRVLGREKDRSGRESWQP